MVVSIGLFSLLPRPILLSLLSLAFLLFYSLIPITLLASPTSSPFFSLPSLSRNPNPPLFPLDHATIGATFKNLKGCDDAKQELKEVVEYLKNPSKFTCLGGKLRKGILFTSALGTRKTLLAKAIAGEVRVPFFCSAGSEFEDMFV